MLSFIQIPNIVWHVVWSGICSSGNGSASLMGDWNMRRLGYEIRAGKLLSLQVILSDMLLVKMLVPEDTANISSLPCCTLSPACG